MTTDIACPKCGEPWEAYHMRHDEPHEWDLHQEDLDRLIGSGTFDGESDPARKAAAVAGWRFVGNSLYAFVSCPCCSRHSIDAQASAAREKHVIAIAEMAGDDHDFLLDSLGFS